MSESLWILVGNTVFIAIFAGIVVWRTECRLSKSVASADKREKAFLEMLKLAQDRIHASTLGDYMTIRDTPQQAPHMSQSRSDEQEAAIEESRMGTGVGLNGGGV